MSDLEMVRSVEAPTPKAIAACDHDWQIDPDGRPQWPPQHRYVCPKCGAAKDWSIAEPSLA